MSQATRDIVFMEGPPPPRQNESWASRLEPLRAAPGRWAKIRTYRTAGSAATMMWHFTSGRVSRIDPAEFQFERRGCDLYAAYKGSQESS